MFYPGGSRKAIIHVDGDAFFASCEQALNPVYRGKPVVTGKERGIVATASYEAKAFGITRAIPLHEARKLCPQLIVLPSNYETYSLFSKRMFEIMRRYTSIVEEYSIDEAFADITGMRRPLNMSYLQIAEHIKKDIEEQLGITVSVGLAPTKVLAKVGSKWNKPSNVEHITHHNLNDYLRKLPVEDVWGIGKQTTHYLKQFNITNAFEFTQRKWEWVEQFFFKPHQELWKELNGESVMPLHSKNQQSYQSISKTKTFTPPSSDKSFVFGQLSKNVENAFIKARRHDRSAQYISLFLKTQDFKYHALSIKLNRPTAYPHEVLPVIKELFKQLFLPTTLYRATGIVLYKLQQGSSTQLNLFEEPLKLEKIEKIYKSVDKLAQKYGKHTIYMGSSLPAHTFDQHLGERGDLAEAKQQRSQQLHSRKFMGLPVLLGKVT